jgi:hypothetical protein
MNAEEAWITVAVWLLTTNAQKSVSLGLYDCWLWMQRKYVLLSHKTELSEAKMYLQIDFLPWAKTSFCLFDTVCRWVCVASKGYTTWCSGSDVNDDHRRLAYDAL